VLGAAVFARDAFGRGGLPDRVFAAFTLGLAGLMLTLAARLAPFYPIERYCFYLIPLLTLGALRALMTRGAPRMTPMVAGAILLAAWAMWGFPHAQAALVVDAPSYTALWRPQLSLGTGRTQLLAGIAAVALVAALTAALRARKRGLALALALAWGLGLTGSAAIAQSTLSRMYARHFVANQAIYGALDPDRPAVILVDGQSYQAVMTLEFFAPRPMRVAYLDHAANAWLDWHLSRGPGNELPALSALPDGARLVASEALPLALPVLWQGEGRRVYRKLGPVRLAPAPAR
jgi:hypothetical protein